MSRGPSLALALALVAGCGVVDPSAERALPPVVVRPLAPGEPALVIGVVGDTGTGRADQYEVAEAMARRVEREPWAFAVFLGDNFYMDGVASVDDPQWQTKFEDVYAAPSLRDLPCYAVLGNHDHQGNVQAQVDYSARSARWRMPATHYAFEERLSDGTLVGFFMLDTTVLNPDTAQGQAHRAWLAEQLAASQADWKVVCGHHPVYATCRKRPNHRTRMAAFLEQTLIDGGVDLYLGGHDHVLELSPSIEGVRYVTSGAGAGSDKAYPIEWSEAAEYVATGGGFVVLRVTREDLVIEFVRLAGETQYACTLRKDAR
ncbi:MAG: metallophosphoesterase [Planctomycetes bacterium]|nr:metallophosphoesterase [Planctomycetota bacterium]